MEGIVALKLENTKTGAWRRLVVKESMTLFNLHRAVQKAFKPRSGDATIEKLKGVTFSFQTNTWSKLGDLNNGSLNALPSGSGNDAFLRGREPLQYSAGGVKYSIQAGKRGTCSGAGLAYVPRCIAGSDGADLDAVNKKLLVTRFDSAQSRNRQNRQLPKYMWFKGGPKLWHIYLSFMQEPV